MVTLLLSQNTENVDIVYKLKKTKQQNLIVDTRYKNLRQINIFCFNVTWPETKVPEKDIGTHNYEEY